MEYTLFLLFPPRSGFVQQWFSSDPKDLECFKNGKWKFKYIVGDIPCERTVFFDSVIRVLDDGSVFLRCNDNFDWHGGVSYSDIRQGGRGFVVTILDNEDPHEYVCFFTFTIDGVLADGVFQYHFDGSYSADYPLIGGCLSSCPQTTAPGDTNQDEKLDLSDVIYILQIITNVRP